MITPDKDALSAAVSSASATARLPVNSLPGFKRSATRTGLS